MNGFERINTVFHGGQPDRVPMMLHCFMPAAREYGLTMKQYRESPENIANAHLAMAEKYGMDGMLIDIDTCILADAIGVPVDYPEDLPARVSGHIVGGFDAMMKGMDPQRVVNSPRVEIALESVRILRKKVGGDLFIRGNCDQMAFSLTSLAYGMEPLMMDVLDEGCQENIMTLMDRATDVHFKFHQLMSEAGADCTSFGDSTSGPDLISPRIYRKFAKPFHKRLNEQLKKANITTICHICGNLDKIVPDIAEIGFPGVEIDYKTNIALAHKAFAGKSVIFGPIDPSGIFCLGTPEDVRRETQLVLDEFSGRGIVIGTGCALPPNTPEENIRAFTETVRSFSIK